MALLQFVFCLVLITIPHHQEQAKAQAAPATPSEAVERAKEPYREWLKLKEPTLEGNIQANKEQARRAKEYVSGFKMADWKAEQLYSLAQLYELAQLWPEAEKALQLFLQDPIADKATSARVSLVSALTHQKKYAEAVPVASQLLDEPVYSLNVVQTVQLLVEKLRKVELKSAVVLAEKRDDKLFKYAESNAQRSPGHAAVILEHQTQLSEMYRENGEPDKAEKYLTTLLAKFNASPLSAHKRIKESVDAMMLRRQLIGKPAPEIAGIEALGLSKWKLADLKGKVILLDFLAHWCGPCLASIPATNALKEKYEAAGLVIVGLTNYYGYYGEQEKISVQQELSLLKELLAKRKANFGVLIGPKTNEAAYGVYGLPAAAVIDRQGTIRFLKEGASYKESVEQVIQTLLAEPVPERKEKH